MDASPDMLARVIARLTGPMHMRFVIQPIMAILLGIRDGVQDARTGAPPFVWDLYATQGRLPKLEMALRRILIPIAVAIVFDAIVQYMLFQEVRVLGAIVLGTMLMGVPYSAARGIANRVARSHWSRAPRRRHT